MRPARRLRQLVVMFAAALGVVALSGAGPATTSTIAAPVPPKVAPAVAAGASFNYVTGRQYASATGASVTLYQTNPEVGPGGGHSLQELAVQSADGRQIVEVGWIKNSGNSGPTLFVYHWVNGKATCYNGCGFVSASTSIKPGMAVTVGASARYGISYSAGNWNVSYKGTTIGHYPGSIWNGTYTKAGQIQAFGEVAATSATSCTDMGNGLPGTNPKSSFVSDFALTGSTATPKLSLQVTAPSRYSAGFATATGFHLGGPGGGPC